MVLERGSSGSLTVDSNTTEMGYWGAEVGIVYELECFSIDVKCFLEAITGHFISKEEMLIHKTQGAK